MLKKILVSLICVCNISHASLAKLCESPPVKYLSEKPVIEDDSHHIHNEVQVEINRSPKDVTIWFDNLAPEKVIKGTNAVSGVKSTCMLSKKAWGEIGSRRLVNKDTGSTFLEEVLENQTQKLFRYEMWNFTNDKTHAIKYAKAYFEVTEIGKGKSILKWHVAFRPNSFIYSIPLSLYVNNSFDPFMKQSLNDIKQYIEES